MPLPPRLDYESRRPPAEDDQPVRLFLIPLVASLLNAGIGCHNGVVEPFGRFAVSDLLIQVAGPAVVIGLWLYWAALAFRHYLRWAVALPLALLAVSKMLIALWLGVGYFGEPWNW